MNREQQIEERRRAQARLLEIHLQEEHNRRVAELLTWWAETRLGIKHKPRKQEQEQQA